MARGATVEDQVIEVLFQARICDLEAITRQCTNLTGNHVFLAVDRVSRRGKACPSNDGVGLGR
jgi:hypothetical protein